jgi:hypothetical protein
LKSVKLSLPVNYSKIIKFANDLAASEFAQVEDATQIHNYFVLVLLMAGVIDDLQSSLNEILKSENIPVSIVIIKVGNLDEQDSSTLMQKASEVLQSSKRQFVSLTELEMFKNNANHFGFEVIKNLPA